MSWDQYCQLHGLGERLKKASFESCTMISPVTLNLGKGWVKNPAKSLYLFGECGTGKTHFLHCLIRGLLERVHIGQIYSIKSKAMDDRILYETLEFKTCKYLVDMISTVQYLFVDDFGMEKATEKTEREYYEIVDRRVDHDLPTVITTNLPLEKIRQTMGTRIHSRLKMFMQIPFIGEDLRDRL